LLWSQELWEDPSVNSMQIAAFQNEQRSRTKNKLRS